METFEIHERASRVESTVYLLGEHRSQYAGDFFLTFGRSLSVLEKPFSNNLDGEEDLPTYFGFTSAFSGHVFLV